MPAREMGNKANNWAALFRLPNLPTAPGDALAGAALASAVSGIPLDPATLAGAGAAALLLYMFGLADNDIAGIESDRLSAPFRPLPSGAISIKAAKWARAACLGSAALAAIACGMPAAWWPASGILLAAICAYNRFKRAWLMGLCRGMSLATGGAAALCGHGADIRSAMSVALASLGWMAYIAAVTKLSEGEERPSEGLGNRRYLLGLSTLAALPACILLPSARLALPPAIGCVFAFVAWCAAVGPLWRAHGPDERRLAVGRAIGGLIYMQTGFMLTVPTLQMLCASCAILLASRIVRRLAPHVSGS